MNTIIINDILIPSILRLYEVDYDNIRYGVSERNICARLAHHMENIMREYDMQHKKSCFDNYFADVEYNRMGKGDLKHYEDSEHRPQYMVSDLLIQTRGYGRNLLAVEMKRKGNYRHAKEDKERLMSLVAPGEDGAPISCVHDTLVGAFIRYSRDEVKILIYENVDGKGVQTDCIIMPYKEWQKESIISHQLSVISNQ